MARLASTIEAILYLKGQALTLAEIAEIACCDKDDAEEGLLELMADYAHRETALEVVETPNGYSLQLREDFQNLVQNLIPADIGKGALRTLAVIALKGPMIQTDLVNLRGSTAYDHVRDLVEKGFVRKRRRSDGRSFWLQVTDKFHQYFQLNQLPGNLDQLLGQSSNTTKVSTATKDNNSETDVAESDSDDTIVDESSGPETVSAPQTEADSESPSVDSTSDAAESAQPEIVGTISDAVLEREEQRYNDNVIADEETEVAETIAN